MYYVSKTLEVAIAHKLNLTYESKCNRLHGHSLKIIVHCKSRELDKNGMVVDFSEIKNLVDFYFDHNYLNDHKQFADTNSTVENIAKFITEEVPYCYKTEIWESKESYACYVEEDF